MPGEVVDDALRAIAETIGTPAYVYLWDRVEERVAALREAFGGRFGLSFAVKANPNRALLRKLSPHVVALDVSSGGELEIALESGYEPARLSFSGPAKTRSELDRAVEIGCGEIIVESVDEMRTLAEVARARAATPRVLLRVNPQKLPRGFGVGMAGAPSHFGIDEEELDAAIDELKAIAVLRFHGFHVYAGTQCLVADVIAEAYANFVSIWSAAAAKHELTCARLVFGSGFGIPYDDGQKELDVAAVAAKVVPLLDAMKQDPWLGGAETLLELGRFLVGRAGVYVARVIRTKESRGKRFCILDGGLNHHLAAAGLFGTVVRRNYPMHKVGAGADEARTPHQLVGPLCTTIDVLGADVKLPEMRAGDLVAIESSGAYGLTASPLDFIAHPRPREVVVDHGAVADVTAEGTPHRAPSWPGDRPKHRGEIA